MELAAPAGRWTYALAATAGVDLEEELTPRVLMNRRIVGCCSPAELCGLVLEEVATLDHVNTSHALYHLAKMPRQRGMHDEQQAEAQQLAIEALTRRMQQLIGNYQSWDVTQSLWAYAGLGYKDEAVMHTLCSAAMRLAAFFRPVDCANVVVAFARLDYTNQQLLRQIISTVLDAIDDFRPGELSQLLWGFARLGCHPGAAFLSEVTGGMQGRLEQYGSQELALILWSSARLRHKPGLRFLNEMEDVLLQRLPHLSPSDSCVAVWSFAHLGYKAVRFLDEVPQSLGPQLHSCRNSELCALISGFATAYHYHRVLLDEASDVILGRLDTFSHHEPDSGKQLAAALYMRMRHFTPQGLAMVVKALAQLQWRSEPLMAELIVAAELKLLAFK
ncbi:hypothetical protein TSOC_004918 [Tetrabaena socialis]|uniref:Uncharacterized protein n=1 Tax=Tetrabaena socialis TaxID=47790 RepID=A0A2J8A7M7_9CHLO|nr:hypothetical protein TSOC_004918 [Tetrabaena socialis]|eukprot:PNH08518.1 hypothetical protein TSOC_004918 [Tetrabaena socialis]